MEVTGIRGRRRKQLPDDLKETWGYRKLKEEALDHTMWRNGFGRGRGRVVRLTAEWMNEWMYWNYHCTVNVLFIAYNDAQTTLNFKIVSLWHFVCQFVTRCDTLSVSLWHFARQFVTRCDTLPVNLWHFVCPVGTVTVFSAAGVSWPNLQRRRLETGCGEPHVQYQRYRGTTYSHHYVSVAS
jgi:hypothetical protein